METFFALLAPCAGNSPVTGEFPSQRPEMFSLIYAWTNVWVNIREAGGRLNKKDGLTRYGDSHVKDKTS